MSIAPADIAKLFPSDAESKPPAADEWGWDEPSAPATALAPTAALPSPTSLPESIAVTKRGRPPGSKNKAPAIMPTCECGTDLNPENASKLRDGTWKHIDCPRSAASPAVAAPIMLSGPATVVLPPDVPKVTPALPTQILLIELGPKTIAALAELLKR